jgi:hypothetical protein
VALACEAFAGGGSAQLELVLVDYNSPPNEALLADALLWPPGCEEVSHRWRCGWSLCTIYNIYFISQVAVRVVIVYNI